MADDEAMRIAQAERFWAKVDKRGPDECWPWLGARSKGYGNIKWNGVSGIRATHASLELAGRPRPNPDLIACHSCDNPPCVNPAHLWWGTLKDNFHDALAKGRLPQAGWQRTLIKCAKGHAFSPRVGHSVALRVCVECRAEADRERRQRLWNGNGTPAELLSVCSPSKRRALSHPDYPTMLAPVRVRSTADFLAKMGAVTAGEPWTLTSVGLAMREIELSKRLQNGKAGE